MIWDRAHGRIGDDNTPSSGQAGPALTELHLLYIFPSSIMIAARDTPGRCYVVNNFRWAMAGRGQGLDASCRSFQRMAAAAASLDMAVCSMGPSGQLQLAAAGIGWRHGLWHTFHAMGSRVGLRLPFRRDCIRYVTQTTDINLSSSRAAMETTAMLGGNPWTSLVLQ